ncbi:RhoGAP [Schizosaccharomyces cryophilus OY26]|uniref:RhoGAP n=1 Tax=Schizosaccharomyces cryophilus (strain OY26 / ATCC MYA-4695 / CBS 11777 / NBRC 106824 / NRRL Y48691) TaxID=653667 RepID=S9VY75_SCHCR|nr:RhoGAP [Schizosaccharomyces cryophilus OY26]EPY52593.1 RhoGAP [Schizosaccharomyces cryophilus OY26]
MTAMWDGFADSFWTRDYITGVKSAQELINQGIEQNKSLLSLLQAKSKALIACSDILVKACAKHDKQYPFSHDTNILLTSAAINELREDYFCEASLQKKWSEQLEYLVIGPFEKWNKNYAKRVGSLSSTIQVKIENYNSRLLHVQRLKSSLLNPKQRGHRKSSSLSSINSRTQGSNKKLESEMPFILAGKNYSNDEFSKFLSTLKKTMNKVSNSQPAEYVTHDVDFQKALSYTLPGSEKSKLEQMTDELAALDMVNVKERTDKSVGTPNSNVQLTQKAINLINTNQEDSLDSSSFFSTQNENKPVSFSNDLDKYYLAFSNLEQSRIELEQYLFTYYKELEKCEIDRLSAIETILADHSGCFSSFTTRLESVVSNQTKTTRSLDKLQDLSNQVKRYYTGYFTSVSNADLFLQNGYESPIKSYSFLDTQISRVVPEVLMYLVDGYSYIKDFDALYTIWTKEVPLKKAYELKSILLNNAIIDVVPILEKYPLHTIAFSLKLCLLEFSDSLIRSSFYDYFNALYSTYTEDKDIEHRVYSIRQCLLHLHSTPLRLLEDLISHFKFFADSAQFSRDDLYKIAKIIAPCILRPPKNVTRISVEDTHPVSLVLDLLQEFKQLFGNLERSVTPPIEMERALTPINTSPTKLKSSRSSSPIKLPSPTKLFRPFS